MRIRARTRTKIKLNSTTPVISKDALQEQSFQETSSEIKLFPGLERNLQYLRSAFDRSSDVIFREFRILDGRAATMIYIDALSDTKLIDSDILAPLTDVHRAAANPCPILTMDQLQQECVTVASVARIRTLDQAVKAVVENMSVLVLIDHEDEAMGLNAGGGSNRSIEEPNTESVIRGPREGFNESLRTSLSLVRRRLRTPDFKVESFEIGRYSKTKIAICYLDGVVGPRMVEEVRTRIKRIETDGIIDSGYIEEFIEDNPYSPFPQVQNTERPDVVSASLLEGRVAIFCDGSPFALIVPITLWGALQAAEDYYERYLIASFVRALRYIFLFINLYLPALYVAISTFHQEMLPEKALLTVAAAREVTPFPALVEALIMEITFEALREAGVRLPKAVGSTISIVGALVIGQAAVQAGIVSAPMVIVVSITGIGSFVIPRYNFAIALRILRFPMIFLAASLGLFGIVIGTLAIVIHLSSLRSLGIPYLSPVSPFFRKNIKDTFLRFPQWDVQWRPFSKSNPRRMENTARPKNRIPGNNRR